MGAGAVADTGGGGKYIAAAAAAAMALELVVVGAMENGECAAVVYVGAHEEMENADWPPPSTVVVIGDDEDLTAAAAAAEATCAACAAAWAKLAAFRLPCRKSGTPEKALRLDASLSAAS